jgi:hypothetical protein
MAAIGSSPAKGWLSNIGGAIGRAVKGIGGGGKGETPVETGGDELEVPPHGSESHTGGAIGGGEGEGEAPWEAMSGADFKAMDKGARKDYMGGLDKGQRQQQMRALMPKMPSFMQNLGGMWSDKRLKENIKRTGKSPSGIPTYEFNYIGNNNRYSGAMAQDLLGTNAVSTHESGFYIVNYDEIDVDMKLL